MKKTGVFYGSTTGTTESVANLIAEKLGIAQADVHDVSKMSADMVKAYEALILGTSTWGDGELQDDWYDGIKVLKGMDLKDHRLVRMRRLGIIRRYVLRRHGHPLRGFKNQRMPFYRCRFRCGLYIQFVYFGH